MRKYFVPTLFLTLLGLVFRIVAGSMVAPSPLCFSAAEAQISPREAGVVPMGAAPSAAIVSLAKTGKRRGHAALNPAHVHSLHGLLPLPHGSGDGLPLFGFSGARAPRATLPPDLDANPRPPSG